MSEIILPTEESKKEIAPLKLVSPEELNTKINLIFAVVCHPETKEMQIVINSHNEFLLATALRRLDRAIDGHLYYIEEKKKQSAIQTVSKVVLDRLNGNV